MPTTLARKSPRASATSRLLAVRRVRRVIRVTFLNRLELATGLPNC